MFLRSTGHNRPLIVEAPSVRNGVKVWYSIGIGNMSSARGSNICFADNRSKRDGVGIGSRWEGSVGEHRSCYSCWLFMHIGLSFNNLMCIRLSFNLIVFIWLSYNVYVFIWLCLYIISLYRFFMNISLCCYLLNIIFWLNMNLGLSSYIIMYIWLSSYILMNIRYSSRDVFILRSRSSKNYC